jgi:hypothetical protein
MASAPGGGLAVLKVALKMSSIAYLIIKRPRRLSPRTSCYSFIHLPLLTYHACDIALSARLDGNLHIGRNLPTTSKAIPLYYYKCGIQLAMRMLQGMAGSGDFEDDRGDSISVGMMEGLSSMRKFVPPGINGAPIALRGWKKSPYRLAAYDWGAELQAAGLPLC